MLIVQVPLVHRNRGYLGGGGGVDMEEAPATASASAPTRRRRARRSMARPRTDVERAVIGHGEEMGPFYEGGGLRLVRDERFPVRVTVQFYRATSNGVISPQDLQDVKAQIDRVYADGDFVGSLVVPESERTRPTDWLRIRHHRRPHGGCGGPHSRCRHPHPPTVGQPQPAAGASPYVAIPDAIGPSTALEPYVTGALFPLPAVLQGMLSGWK